jgi:hypothetical protein
LKDFFFQIVLVEFIGFFGIVYFHFVGVWIQCLILNPDYEKMHYGERRQPIFAGGATNDNKIKIRVLAIY